MQSYSILLIATVTMCVLQNTHYVKCGVVKRSDDVSLEGLQVLVQQQAAAISSLQASLASLQNVQSKVAELDAKVGTLSKAVVFSATFSADDNSNGVPLSPHAILQFDHVVTNAGNGYNPANGIFTAPVAGYYAFSIVMMVPNAASHPSLAVSVVKNGAVVDMAWATNSANLSDEQGSTLVTLHLALGDQIWVRQESGDAIRGSFWTVYSGYLVHTE